MSSFDYNGIITDLKCRLEDYLIMKGKKIGPNGLFSCPNSAAHKNGDKNPSCSLLTNPDGTQKWYCHGCQESGSIYDAAHYLDSIPVSGPHFIEATKYLANSLNIYIDPQLMNYVNTEGAITGNEYVDIYRDIEEYIVKHGNAIENLTNGKFGRYYSKEQAERVVSMLPIGSVDHNELYTYLMDKYGDRFKDTPIYKYNKRNTVFSNNSLTISYRDPAGTPIRFIARRSNEIINNPNNTEKISKYIQTSGLGARKKEHPFFMDIAKDEIRRSRQAIVVEGEFDTISMHLLGFNNTIGSRGAAFTEDFAARLHGMKIYEVIFIFDPDVAGMRGLRKALPYFTDRDITVFTYPLPEDIDPDTILTQNLKIDLNNKVNAIEYLLKYHPDFASPDIPETVRYGNALRFILEVCRQTVYQKVYADTIMSDLFCFNAEDIFQDLRKMEQGLETRDVRVQKIHREIESLKDAPLSDRITKYEEAAENLRTILAEKGKDISNKTYNTYIALKRNDVKLPTRLLTGVERMDQECSFLSGTVSIWAGWPSNGKTTSCREMALKVLDNNPGIDPIIVYFSFDDDDRTTMMNFITMITHTPTKIVRDLYIRGEWEDSIHSKEYEHVIENMFKNNIYIINSMECPDVGSVQRVLNAVQSQHPNRTIWAIVDAMNNFVDFNKDNQLAAAEQIVRDLKRYSKRYDAHIAIVAHFTKHQGIIRRPRLSDLKGSSFLEHEAQNIILSYMETHYKQHESMMVWGPNHNPVIELTIAKDKNHKANETLPFNFDPYTLHLYEPTHDDIMRYSQSYKGGE